MSRFIPLLILLSCLLPAHARRQAAAVNPRTEADSVTVSLITCGPGKEIFELCGHEAVRVRYASGADTIWNYGLFSFDQPNFVYRFVKGETDYRAGAYPSRYFFPEYFAGGRSVIEQELNLTPERREELLRLLRRDLLPENREYRYNYVRDNCATRIVDRLEEAGGGKLLLPDTLAFGTWRNEMRAFHGAYPWYQFGIDLALGGNLDRPLRPREELFVPMVMAERLASARWSDGTPVVRSTVVLNEGRADASLPPTPWYLSPLFCCWLFFAITTLLCVLMIRRKKIYGWLYFIWFLVCGLAGCVIAFLVFISSHEATSPNLLLFWLNPLQLVMAVCSPLRGRANIPARAMAWLNCIVLTILLIVWPWQPQSANPAFFPLIGATLLLSVIYLLFPPKKQ